MTEIVLLCGIPASGKSTWRAAHLPDHVVVSKDLIPNVRRKDARQARDIRAAIAAGRPVVVDDTNLTPDVRARFVALAEELGVPCRAVVFPFDPDLALERNRHREGRARVPDGILIQMAARWQEPGADEGFVRIDGSAEI